MTVGIWGCILAAIIVLLLVVCAVIAGDRADDRAAEWDEHTAQALAIQDDHELVGSMDRHPSGQTSFTSADARFLAGLGPWPKGRA